MWGPHGPAAREEIAPKGKSFQGDRKSLRGRGHTEAFKGGLRAEVDKDCTAPLSTSAFFGWRLD
jgi:hypothetical protein